MCMVSSRDSQSATNLRGHEVKGQGHDKNEICHKWSKEYYGVSESHDSPLIIAREHMPNVYDTL